MTINECVVCDNGLEICPGCGEAVFCANCNQCAQCWYEEPLDVSDVDSPVMAVLKQTVNTLRKYDGTAAEIRMVEKIINKRK